MNKNLSHACDNSTKKKSCEKMLQKLGTLSMTSLFVAKQFGYFGFQIPSFGLMARVLQRELSGSKPVFNKIFKSLFEKLLLPYYEGSKDEIGQSLLDIPAYFNGDGPASFAELFETCEPDLFADVDPMVQSDPNACNVSIAKDLLHPCCNMTSHFTPMLRAILKTMKY